MRDVCDIGQMLFWGKKWAWYATAVMFILNNTVRLQRSPISHILLTIDSSFKSVTQWTLREQQLTIF